MSLACYDLTRRESDVWYQFIAALQVAGLPTEDLAEPGQSFFAFHASGQTAIGFGGYLLADGDALLRSIVVVPSQRRQGLGSEILTQLLARAVADDAHTAWLLTIDAERFFARHEFVRRERTEAPPAIAATPQFASLCPASAVLMSRRLR